MEINGSVIGFSLDLMKVVSVGVRLFFQYASGKPTCKIAPNE